MNVQEPGVDEPVAPTIPVPALPAGKRYNQWCHRRPLVRPRSPEGESADHSFSWQPIDPAMPFAERSFVQARTLTGDDGCEFVVFSSVKLPGPITLVGGVVLVPCFFEGWSRLDDPVGRASMRMGQLGRYVYDGWVPVEQWADRSASEAARRIDEALASFSLVVDGSFDWEPKYALRRESRGTAELEAEHLQRLEALSNAMTAMSSADRDAILRSAGWLSQAARVRDPMAEFLFYILAVESLATHIELHAVPGSALAPLRAVEWKTDAHTHERAERARALLEGVGPTASKDQLLRLVQRLTEQCLDSNRKVIEANVKKVLAAFGRETAILFKGEEGRPSLFALRNRIAHGSLDTVSEIDRHRIMDNVWRVSLIARTYVLHVLSLVTGIAYNPLTFMGGINLSLTEAILSHERQWQGPTHMALLYGI